MLPMNRLWKTGILDTCMVNPIWNSISGRKHPNFLLGYFGFQFFIENTMPSVRKTKQSLWKTKQSLVLPGKMSKNNKQSGLRKKKKKQWKILFEKQFCYILKLWNFVYVSHICLHSMSSQRMETLTLSSIFPPASSLSASILMENQETFFDWSLTIRNLVSS